MNDKGSSTVVRSSDTIVFCDHRLSFGTPDVKTENISFYCKVKQNKVPIVYLKNGKMYKLFEASINGVYKLFCGKNTKNLTYMPDLFDHSWFNFMEITKESDMGLPGDITPARTYLMLDGDWSNYPGMPAGVKGVWIAVRDKMYGDKIIDNVSVIGTFYDRARNKDDPCFSQKKNIVNNITQNTSDLTQGSKSKDYTDAGFTSPNSSNIIYNSPPVDFTNNPAINASDGYVIPLEHLGSDKNWLSELQTNASFFNMRSVLGVFGLPYQFLPTADPRLTPSNSNNTDTMTSLENSYLSDLSKDYGDTLGIGEEYAEHIVANLPILFMSPGMPNFMGSYSEEDKKDVLHKISTLIGITDEDYMTNLADRKNSKYYTFQYKVTDYYRYVNPMCRLASQYLGIGETPLDGVPLHSVNWMDYTSKKIKALFESDGPVEYLSIPFYIESENQISENMSNDTQEPMLAGLTNGVADQAREMQFILGYANGNDLFNAIKANPDITSNADNINTTINNALNGGKNNFLSKLTSHIGMLIGGAKLLFPKVWSGSAFSRSYDITIKLRSPDMDNLSLYFNIIVPTFHLIGFVAPHSMETNPNGYGNPFIVRAIYKGFFNVDMGIITSMGITKGDQAQWNANGIPSSVDINFTISDLYECMGITPTGTSLFDNKLFNNHIYETMDNTAQMDYIANFCGINIYKPEIGRLVSMWAINNIKNKATDMITINMWGNIRNSVASRIMGIFRAG